jgi:hypothetical protein
MSQAASEMLGPTVSVRTETFPEDHPEAVPAPASGERSAVVSWDSPQHEHARLRVCRAANDCVERWVTFETTDPELERGRTLGFLTASIFRESSQPKAAPTPVPAPARSNAPKPPPEYPRGEISAAAVVSGPGTGTTLGASLAADYAFSMRFRLGLAAELRFGEVPEAQASSRIGSLLLRTTFVAFRPSRSAWLGADVGLGVYQLLVSHFSSDDLEPDRQGRFLFGGTVGAVGGLDFNKSSGVYLELGAEILSGKTGISVHDEERASWPVVNPTARLGIRAAF